MGLAPNVDPGEVGVMEGEGAPVEDTMAAADAEDIAPEGGVVEEGMTPEAMEAAAATAEAPPAVPPVANPAAAAAIPPGMPVMASARTPRSNVGVIQDLTARLRRG